MKKRFISTVLCAAMAASLVTGCGSGSGNASGGSTQAAADTGSKKEVVIWDYFETDAQKAIRYRASQRISDSGGNAESEGYSYL